MIAATWIAFIGYSIVAIALGWRAARNDPGDAFWTAGRDLSGASVGVSISAGFLSVSWSCVYAVQLFYWYGLGAIWLITIPWLCALFAIFLLSRRYHALPAFSQPEMVGQRFGSGTRRVVATALAFVFLVWGGAEIYVAANLLAPAMAVPAGLMIVLISLVVGVYSTVGGFAAVVNTDKLQYGIVALYILAMGGLAWIGLTSVSDDGNATGALAALLAEPPTGVRSGEAWTGLLAPGLGLIALTFIAYLPGWAFETDLWLRVQAARDARAARSGVAFAAANSVLFLGVLPMFIGVAALVLFPASDGLPPAIVGIEGEAIFAALVATYAPAWLALLVAIGLVAAAMSTIDTCANVMGLSVAYDLLHEPHRSPAAAARLARATSAGAVAAACVFALLTDSLWDIFYLSSGILTTAVAFPVAAVFLPRVRAAAVLFSAVAGLIGTAAAYVLEAYGPLSRIEPAWLADSGVGFVAWGVLAAALGAAAGQLRPDSPI